ncbi:DUF1631 domain-containing protein [soil metagenome]
MDSFARCFIELCPRIEEELFAAAEREPDRVKQSRYLDAYGLIHANRTRIESGFREAIERIIRSRLTGEAEQATANARRALDATSQTAPLSLMEDAAVEADIFIRRMAGRLRRSADEATSAELKDLDERVSYLLGTDPQDETASPFSADALARAIQSSIDDLGSEHAVRLEILRIFENFAGQGFTQAFHALNEHLAQHNVLPDIVDYRRQRLTSRRFVSNDATATQPGGGRVDTRAAPPAAHLGEPIELPRPADSLLDAFTRFRARQPREQYGENDYGTPDTFWPTVLTSVLSHLPTLVPTTPNVAAAMAGVVTVPLSDLNLLHQVRDNARRLGAPRDEEILIDLVAVLLDKILQDKQVPERIKRLIARLQVPLLRAALLDRTLFAQKAHPARRLLDVIARSAVGWDEDSDPEGRYYQLIFEVVAQVEAGFGNENRAGDLTVFEDQRLKIDAFLADEAAREHKRYERAQALLQQVEQREVADMQALMQIRDAVRDIELPEEVTDFLLDPWRRVLVEAAVSGASETTRNAFRQTISDMVWSVQPKVSIEERRQLVDMLPPLLQHLRAGLTAIDCPGAEQETFFAMLMQQHSQAVKVGVRSELQDRAFKQFEERVNAISIDPDSDDGIIDISPDMIKASIADSRITMSLANEPVEPPARVLERPARMTVEYLDSAIDSLTRGSWVEVVQGTLVKPLRLRWISPRKTMYLFTDRLGKEAISFTPDLLRVHVADGLLSVLDSKDLTERAIDEVHNSMN